MTKQNTIQEMLKAIYTARDQASKLISMFVDGSMGQIQVIKHTSDLNDYAEKLSSNLMKLSEEKLETEKGAVSNAIYKGLRTIEDKCIYS
ncbi:hypothetical protein IID23_02210 [Patescibacteria group bacterium]|nr:hypothetical protein [Patescibacteria group bacterium]